MLIPYRLLRIEDIHCVEDIRVSSSTGDKTVTLNKLDVPNSLTAFTASNRGIQVCPNSLTAYTNKNYIIQYSNNNLTTYT